MGIDADELDGAEIERVVAGLSSDQRLYVTDCWDAFCDADPLPINIERDAYTDQLEALGLAELVDVDGDALDDPFAYERGIEPGGMMWRLTSLGLAVRAHLARTERRVEGGGA